MFESWYQLFKLAVLMQYACHWITILYVNNCIYVYEYMYIIHTYIRIYIYSHTYITLVVKGNVIEGIGYNVNWEYEGNTHENSGSLLTSLSFPDGTHNVNLQWPRSVHKNLNMIEHYDFEVIFTISSWAQQVRENLLLIDQLPLTLPDGSSSAELGRGARLGEVTLSAYFSALRVAAPLCWARPPHGALRHTYTLCSCHS